MTGNIYTYKKVEEIRDRFLKGKEISREEIQILENYVEHKKKVAHLSRDSWSRKQLANAELLLNDLKLVNKEGERV